MNFSSTYKQSSVIDNLSIFRMEINVKYIAIVGSETHCVQS